MKTDNFSSGRFLCMGILWVLGPLVWHMMPLSDGGRYTDPRDGQTYNTVTIGDVIWWTENLNYRTPHSMCYEYLESHCEKYGRLYPVYEAPTACPEYWRLPYPGEVDELYRYMRSRRIFSIAAPGEWDIKKAPKVTNRMGLSILPAGRIDSFSVYSDERQVWVDTFAFHQLGTAASFWLNDIETHEGLVHWHLGSPMGESRSGMHRHHIDPEVHRFSIRCVCKEKERK